MTELTDRMRTCVAHLETIEISIVLTDDQMEAILDARKMLIEAADELERPPVVLQPWVPIEAPTSLEAAPRRPAVSDLSGAAWIDPGVPDLPTQPLSRNACPKCDSRATKTVHATKNGFRLECRVCGHTWKR